MGLEQDEYKVLVSFTRAVYAFLSQYLMADKHNTEQQARIDMLERSDDNYAAYPASFDNGFIDMKPLWEHLYNECLKFKGFLITSNGGLSQEKVVNYVVRQIDYVLPIIKANSLPVIYVMGADPLKRHQLNQGSYQEYLAELEEHNRIAKEDNRNRSPEATNKALKVLEQVGKILETGKLSLITSAVNRPQYKLSHENNGLKLAKVETYISSSWRDPLTQDQIRQTEENCGPLANNLAELAEIIREADCVGESEAYSETANKLSWRAVISAKKLRPLLDMAVGEKQATEFYFDLCGTLRYHEECDIVGWCGGGGKAESLAQRLDQWHRNVLLLTHEEKVETERETEAGKERSIESTIQDLPKQNLTNKNMTSNLLFQGIEKFNKLISNRRQVIEELENNSTNKNINKYLGKLRAIDKELATGGVAIYEAALLLNLPTRPECVLHLATNLGEDEEEKYISKAEDELLQLTIEAKTKTNSNNNSVEAKQNIKPKAETWSQVSIDVLDNDTVRYKVADKQWKRANYAELGFANKLNGLPNQLWPIFRDMAKHSSGGYITMRTLKNISKDVDRIRATLRKFFGIKEIPIKYMKNKKAYKVYFNFSYNQNS